METNALIVWSRAGLANRLHALINGLYLKEKTQRPVYSCWPLNEHLSTPVNNLFTYPLPLTSEVIARSVLQSPLHNVVRFLEKELGRVSVRSPLILDEIPSEFIRKCLRQIHWHPSILEEVERLRYSHRLDSTVSGIHARGTDITSPEKLKIEVIRAINSLEGRIWLITDEPQIFPSLPSRVIMISRPKRTTDEGMKMAIVDLLLLSKTRIRYYSPKSTFSWVAIALSCLPVACIPRKQRDQALTIIY